MREENLPGLSLLYPPPLEDAYHQRPHAQGQGVVHDFVKELGGFTFCLTSTILIGLTVALTEY